MTKSGQHHEKIPEEFHLNISKFIRNQIKKFLTLLLGEIIGIFQTFVKIFFTKRRKLPPFDFYSDD